MQNPPADSATSDNPFWRYSLAVYGRPGVAELCLDLQDGAGMNVNLVLLAGWLAAGGIAIGPDDVRAFASGIAPWHGDVVKPLRAARRALKPARPGEQPRAALYADAKRLELGAEQAEQVILYDLARSRFGASRGEPAGAADNVAAILATAGLPAERGRMMAAALDAAAAAARVPPNAQA